MTCYALELFFYAVLSVKSLNKNRRKIPTYVKNVSDFERRKKCVLLINTYDSFNKYIFVSKQQTKKM